MKSSHDSEVLKENQQVITVCAFIYRLCGGEVELFLPQRASTKKFLPNVFELPGGHVDFGEELVPALKREIQEEFNIEINVGELFDAFTYINEIKKSHSVELIYFAQMSENCEVEINPEDHSNFIWVSKKRLHEAFTVEKGEEDPEFQAVKKGFKILETADNSSTF